VWFSRNGRDLSKQFPTIIEAVRKLKAQSAIIEGEIVCLDENGRTCVEDLQNFGSELENNLFFYAFDLAHLNGVQTVIDPIEKRKERLRELIAASGTLRLFEFVECDPEALVTFARENRLEGVVAKRLGSRYEPGKRSGAWAKSNFDELEGHYLQAANLPEFSANAALKWSEVTRKCLRLTIFKLTLPLEMNSELQRKRPPRAIPPPSDFRPPQELLDNGSVFSRPRQFRAGHVRCRSYL
jgi:hypothetical protein